MYPFQETVNFSNLVTTVRNNFEFFSQSSVNSPLLKDVTEKLNKLTSKLFIFRERIIKLKDSKKNIVRDLGFIKAARDGSDIITKLGDNNILEIIFKDIEFIFLDCNSPEDEKSYILPLIDKYKNIKYFKLDKDPGLYAAWNHAVGLCSADIICIWYIDDIQNSYCL